MTKSDIHKDHINITGEDVVHIRKVLRLVPGDNIVVCDGEKSDYEAVIEEIKPDYVRARIKCINTSNTEPLVEVSLFQGIPKSDKMDYIIQKCVELGVNRIVPVVTERTIVRIENGKAGAAKTERWQRIALEAAKQCNRGIIPRVEQPVGFEEALGLSLKAQISIIPYEYEQKNGIRTFITGKEIERIGVFIGPEGGFSEKEIDKAVEEGIIPVTLGPRILRTETAGVAVMAILMYELGDVG